MADGNVFQGENGRHHNAVWEENDKMDNRKWERRVGRWGGGGGQREGKGIAERRETHKERRKRKTKGEISNKLRRISDSNGIQITNVIQMTTEGGGT